MCGPTPPGTPRCTLARRRPARGVAFASGSVRLRILDVVDVWPDSLPFPRWLRLLGWPGFRLWRWSFEIACSRADVLLVVSDRCLADGLGSSKGRRRERRACTRVTTRCPALTLPVRRSSPSFTSATSGGCTTSTPCSPRCRSKGTWRLFIVGEGDRRAWLLEELSRRDLPHEYFGSVYEPAALARILRRAHSASTATVTPPPRSPQGGTYLAAGLRC